MSEHMIDVATPTLLNARSMTMSVSVCHISGVWTMRPSCLMRMGMCAFLCDTISAIWEAGPV